MLSEIIGKPAMLEQTAEEAVELAHAALKLARYLRGENEVYGRSEYEMKVQLVDEIADILVCIDELKDANLIEEDDLSQHVAFKIDRMEDRLKEKGLFHPEYK